MPDHPNPWKALAPYVGDAQPAEQAPFGILSPASLVLEGAGDGGRWVTGFDYEARDCSTTVTVSSTTTADTYTVVEGDPEACYLTYAPFMVEVEQARSTFNRESDWEADTTARLLACQQKAIEREFWTGTLARAQVADNRYLASTDAVDVTPTPGTAVKPAYGAALLEDALAQCGCGIRGTIHTTRGVASSLGLSAEDDTLSTTLGTRAVVGAGYTGSGPGNTAPVGSARWVYATGPLTVRLGDVENRAGSGNGVWGGNGLDVNTNRYSVYAERAAAVTWDSCCHFAVLVDLALDYS